MMLPQTEGVFWSSAFFSRSPTRRAQIWDNYHRQTTQKQPPHQAGLEPPRGAASNVTSVTNPGEKRTPLCLTQNPRRETRATRAAQPPKLGRPDQPRNGLPDRHRCVGCRISRPVGTVWVRPRTGGDRGDGARWTARFGAEGKTIVKKKSRGIGLSGSK